MLLQRNRGAGGKGVMGCAGGREHPQGTATALTAPQSCRCCTGLYWELLGQTRVFWACWSKAQSSQRAWESYKGTSGSQQHAPSRWYGMLGIFFQGTVCPSWGFVHHSLSGVSLLMPLVPQDSLGCSLNAVLVYLVSVLDLCLLHAVLLSLLIFQPRPALGEALTSL